MKINTDVFPVKDIKKDGRSQDQRNNAQKTENRGDTVTINVDKKGHVAEENKSAAKTGFNDIKKVEEVVGELKGLLAEDLDIASDIHQLGEKSIVSISQD